jgi:hypothetical protein
MGPKKVNPKDEDLEDLEDEDLSFDLPEYFYRDPGNPDEDPPDEELFMDLESMGTTPEELMKDAVSPEDKAFARRYKKWVEAGGSSAMPDDE